ncbi:NAD-dependent epimerase/dehydratase family protein [Solicola gregarius]|uniref:NAD-dependent epimerase/dehydratase family protein n=1 Tax=Solicola gregarius TaxID=2908642 RepID=A0AA46THW4_9ACTN|nr:NAD-dependent epimerase/dehydratase family protein [Solicola gregarius]UYM05560.1 NAD-dependent epimerase/dehydratase family protein [Solicola gregarius]
MSDKHVIVGAGPVGTELATVLAAADKQVTVVTRSGRGVEARNVSRVAADASDGDGLARLTDGAVALYNCANPGDYTTWQAVWPPLAASLLGAARKTGAVLVTAASLYPYGPVDVPMVEDLPDAATDKKGLIRAGMWADALDAHRAGEARVVEVRGSDYVGTGVGKNGHVSRNLPRALAGKGVRVIGDPDLPHSWTDVLDMARTLAAVADDADAWGRVWHAPTNAPRTQSEALGDVLAAVGKRPVPVKPFPMRTMRLIGRFNPMVRELMDMSYMFTRPYVLDSSAAEERYGLEPTPWDEVCRRTAAG